MALRMHSPGVRTNCPKRARGALIYGFLFWFAWVSTTTTFAVEASQGQSSGQWPDDKAKAYIAEQLVAAGDSHDAIRVVPALVKTGFAGSISFHGIPEVLSDVRRDPPRARCVYKCRNPAEDIAVAALVSAGAQGAACDVSPAAWLAPCALENATSLHVELQHLRLPLSGNVPAAVDAVGVSAGTGPGVGPMAPGDDPHWSTLARLRVYGYTRATAPAAVHDPASDSVAVALATDACLEAGEHLVRQASSWTLECDGRAGHEAGASEGITARGAAAVELLGSGCGTGVAAAGAGGAGAAAAAVGRRWQAFAGQSAARDGEGCGELVLAAVFKLQQRRRRSGSGGSGEGSSSGGGGSSSSPHVGDLLGRPSADGLGLGLGQGRHAVTHGDREGSSREQQGTGAVAAASGVRAPALGTCHLRVEGTTIDVAVTVQSAVQAAAYGEELVAKLDGLLAAGRQAAAGEGAAAGGSDGGAVEDPAVSVERSADGIGGLGGSSNLRSRLRGASSEEVGVDSVGRGKGGEQVEGWQQAQQQQQKQQQWEEEEEGLLGGSMGSSSGQLGARTARHLLQRVSGVGLCLVQLGSLAVGAFWLRRLSGNTGLCLRSSLSAGWVEMGGGGGGAARHLLQGVSLTLLHIPVRQPPTASGEGQLEVMNVLAAPGCLLLEAKGRTPEQLTQRVDTGIRYDASVQVALSYGCYFVTCIHRAGCGKCRTVQPCSRTALCNALHDTRHRSWPDQVTDHAPPTSCTSAARPHPDRKP